MCRRCVWFMVLLGVVVGVMGAAWGQTVYINFQSNSEGDRVVPDGYLPDYGEVFGDRGNGWSYGWNRNITADARDRNNANSQDQRYDTLNHLQKASPPAIWEIEIEKGVYNILMICGDPANSDQTNTMLVEGVLIVDPNGQTGNFDKYELTVEVTDGRLTITADADAGASNSKISFVHIVLAIPPEAARSPSPAKEAIDVPRDVVMTWEPGEGVSAHDVYFGTSLDDVGNASRANPMGVLLSQAQSAATYDPDGLLDFETSYYWRIDEVLTAGEIFQGEVWSFTTEPFVYAVQNVIVTASSSAGDAVPENTINGSGLDENDGHSTESQDMWLTTADAERPVWIQYEFDRVYKMHELLVWNYNVQFDPVLGFGAKDVTVEYSADGAEWALLGDVEFARATAVPGYAANTTVDMGGVAAKYVRLTISDNWGSLTQIGLSEVRFMYIPAHAREPQPASDAADASVDSALTWRAGRDAVSHEVYFGTDQNDLSLAGSPAQSAFTPAELIFGTTYYWRVDEVGDDAVWAGDLWSFATQEFALIDGFETYTDDIEAGEAIFDTWLDGWVNNTGSMVGYITAPFAEKTIVRSGTQSMPLFYDNTTSPFYSETERVFASPQNWTGNGADTLAVYFQGLPASFLQLADGKVILGAAGTDIWGTADEFRFAYKNLSGDGSLIAYVESVSRANEWTKGGVMIRETLEAGSKFAAVYSTPDYGCRYQARLTMGVDAVSDSSIATDEQIALRAPHWVKIERVGSSFNGYYSTDGENWTAMAWNPQTIVMGANAYIGLVLTSHAAGVLASAEFSGITTTGNVSGQWTVETIGPAQPDGNTAAPLYVRVEDATGKAATVTHPAGNGAVFLAGWNEWRIPLSEFAGVNPSRVDTMVIGVGNRTSPTAGGTGIVYIDDVGFGKPATE